MDEQERMTKETNAQAIHRIENLSLISIKAQITARFEDFIVVRTDREDP
jgi:hypothetical protein